MSEELEELEKDPFDDDFKEPPDLLAEEQEEDKRPPLEILGEEWKFKINEREDKNGVPEYEIAFSNDAIDVFKNTTYVFMIPNFLSFVMNTYSIMATQGVSQNLAYARAGVRYLRKALNSRPNTRDIDKDFVSANPSLLIDFIFPLVIHLCLKVMDHSKDLKKN